MTRTSIEMQEGERLEAAWMRWKQDHAAVMAKVTSAQCALLEATVRFVAAIGGQAIMTRAAAFFLLHAGMGLTPSQVGAALGRTDRAMRTVQALSAQDFLASVWAELKCHRQPKLRAEHASPIAKYLVNHPRCTQAEVVAFIEREFQIHLDELTLRRFCKAYGFGVLRSEPKDADRANEDAPRPFPLGVPSLEEPFFCCPARFVEPYRGTDAGGRAGKCRESTPLGAVFVLSGRAGHRAHLSLMTSIRCSLEKLWNDRST